MLPPTTSAFLRCSYAIPWLVVLSWWWRRSGKSTALTTREVRWSIIAGIAFGADLVLWHICIDSVGAGLATILGNTQIVLYPLAAWIMWNERPQREQMIALPVLLFGIILISGVGRFHAYGDAPFLGVITGVLTGVAYAGFLIGMRAGAPSQGGVPVAQLTIATSVAALVAGISALAVGVFEVIPAWPGIGWMLLLAWICQVLAWMLITGSLNKVTAARISILLLIQPLTALLLGIVLLDEAPSVAQLIGAGIVLLGVIIGAVEPNKISQRN